MKIIAVNIKSGGGRELLLYLARYIKSRNLKDKFSFYVDTRFITGIDCSQNISVIQSNNLLKKIFCFVFPSDNSLFFGNLPPVRKVDKSAVYFHNAYLLMSVTDLFREKVRFAELIKIIFLQFYIFFFISNVGKVFVQSSLIEKKFVKKYKFSNTEVMPFYEEPKNLANNKSKKYDFCYISLSHPHKQHNMLLIAFEKLLAKGYAISCALTVDSSDKKLLDKIFYLNKKYKAKIENFGVVPRKKVKSIYQNSKCLVFPSSKETFGLPLIEAASLGLDIIAPDLAYVHEVIEPSLVFEPNSADSLFKKLKHYYKHGADKPKCKTENKVSKLLSYFKEL